jgi:hypothetical protein
MWCDLDPAKAFQRNEPVAIANSQHGAGECSLADPRVGSRERAGEMRLWMSPDS